MQLRSVRERIIQTLSYELGGLLLATPVYSLAFGDTVEDSAILVFAMSVAAATWCCIHNTLFDMAEQGFTGRLASDRPQVWRLVHAISNEFTSVLVTLPIIMWLGGYGFWAALAIDLGFTAFYAAYAYVFHMAYDRLRPMRQQDGIVLTMMSRPMNDDHGSERLASGPHRVRASR